MNLIAIILCALSVLATGNTQNYNPDYTQFLSGFGPYYRAIAPMRDPRSNTGPVLFPSGPPQTNAESSGVIVGASGFGFVPPNSGFWAYYF